MPVDYAARRSAKLAAQQASLPPEERIVNRDDWEDAIQKRVSVLTRQARVNSRNAFVDTAIDPAVGICQTRDEAEAFFRPGGTRFTCKILRIFLEASALSRDGRIDEVVAARTLRSLVANLFEAAKVAGNDIDRDVKNDTMLFIEGSLIPRGLAHTTARVKPTPIPRDITTFLKNLFDRRFMAPLPSTRDVLLIALFVCLSIDCSTRLSELVMPSLSTKNTAAYKTQHKDKLFTWSCVEMFAFKDEGHQNVYMQARITFKDLKKPFGLGPNLTKTIPLRLLPPEYAAEDSLFWLVILALIDDVFVSVSSWSDINRLRPGPNGMKIHIKGSMMQVPVFRIANRPQSKNWRVKDALLISPEPMDSTMIRVHLRSLSRFCGLEHAILPSVLRRGAAYQLALAVSSEERCARMGHSGDDPSYWRYYRNRTSTVDFQARRHGIEERDVEMMSSMFLDKGYGRPPPVRVSVEGMSEVYRDPELLALLAEQSAFADGLILQHGSLEAARTIDPDGWKTYQQLRNRHSNKLNYLSQKKFDAEYKAYWETRGCVDSDAAQQPIPKVGRSEVDLLLDDQDAMVVDAAAPSEEEIREEAEARDALSELAASLDAIEVDDGLDVVQETPAAGAPSSAGSTGWFGTREVARYSLVDEVAKHLYEQPQDATWESLADYFVTAFNHLHSADRFFPGQEPLPGTFDCRFCGLYLHSAPGGIRNAQKHAWNCEAERLARHVLDQLRAGDATALSVCPMLCVSVKDDTTLVSCKSKSQTSQTFSQHLAKKHCTSTHFACLNHTPVVATDSIADMRIHAVAAHHAPTSILASNTPKGELSIPRTEELEHVHIGSHMGDAVEIVAARGMTGLWMNMRWVHPCFCPFCLYDLTLDYAARLRSLAQPHTLLGHIKMHLNKLSGTMPCPASTSTLEGLPQCPESKSLTSAEMAIHLRSAHGFDIEVSGEDDLDDVQPKRNGDDQPKNKRAKTGSRSPLSEMDGNRQTGYNHSGEN
ncbi:hypothetical protein INS49_004377 [Diaporthe citri]|uniref:uncharacterized protein n=1 Tax=Diaporthe citri TaxID=83186 RepID=UPI001C7FAB61|nr:uncharacterized protein INS49_004377 [Diaporthe citri]KAG6354360.1 hypothetical protein INS49_004377 [Diaporthe citri]